MAKKVAINKDLFENQDVMVGSKTLFLHDVTSEKAYMEMQAQLCNSFTMNELKEITKLVHSLTGAYKICDADDQEKLLKCMYPPLHGFKYKNDYERYLACIFASEENFKTIFSLLDTPTQIMLGYLFRHGYATPEDLDKQSGRKWYSIADRYSYWDRGVSTLHPACCMMQLTMRGYYSTAQRFVCLKDFFWNIYSNNMFPDLFKEKLNSEGVDMLPEGIDWTTYSNEKNVGNQIQIIGQLLQQGVIDFGEKKMTAAMVKKIDKQLNVPEFFTDATFGDGHKVENKDKLLAASLAIPILSNLLSGLKDLTEYHVVLKKVFAKYSMQYVLFDMIAHLKGLKRNDVLDYSYFDDHEKLLQYSLKTLKPVRWYPLDEVQLRMYSSPSVSRRYLSVFSVGMSDRSNITKSDGKYLTPGDYYDEVQCPITCGYLALYATCGLLDVAYTNKVGIGAYSFIKYIRLTKLGAYVLGQTKSYEATSLHKPIEYFEADPYRLIVFCKQIEGKNPYEGLLTSLAEKISENRYRVTPKTWLKDCDNASDLETKQNFFMENICKTPSVVWLGFFNNMLNRCSPLKKTAVPYIVKQLDPSNKELQQLFVTDSYLRKHSLRGERFTILIETRFLTKVEEKLREYGYLV